MFHLVINLKNSICQFVLNIRLFKFESEIINNNNQNFGSE